MRALAVAAVQLAIHVFPHENTAIGQYVTNGFGKMLLLFELLYKLALEHVINYIPSDHSSVIYVHHARLRPGNVQLSPQQYALLKENYRLRSQAMEEYASQNDECRQRFLLRYFGQEESGDCGKCDVCRRGKGVREKLKAFLDANPNCTAADLAAFCANPANGISGDVSAIARELLDQA